MRQGGSGEEGAPAPMDAMSVLHEARALLSGGGGGPRGPDEFSSHTAMGSIYPSQDQLVRSTPTCCRRVSRARPGRACVTCRLSCGTCQMLVL